MNNFRIVGFDFETTGLSHIEDEPIQVGLVEFDLQGNLIREYSEYIKPDMQVEKIDPNVFFITRIDPKILKKAKKMKVLEKKICNFFDENTIVVGHNINFDLKFLKQYYNINYYDYIDTYKWALNFCHFQESYALEVLIDNLKIKNKDFKKIFEKIAGNKINYHDALYDAKISCILFFYFRDYIGKLFDNYKFLRNIVGNSNCILNKIFDIEPSFYRYNINLKPLEKLVQKESKILKKSDIKLLELQIGKKYYIGNLDLKYLIEQIISNNKKIILSFSNPIKLEIIRKIINDFGVKNIGYAKQEQLINYKVFESFLKKGEFTEDEIFFILKYVSCLYSGYGSLDINSKKDNMIYYFLKYENKYTNQKTLLSSHSGLYHLLDNTDKFDKDYFILFFDLENWYNSYNNYKGRECDLLNIVSYLETLVYIYSVRNQIKKGKYETVFIYLKQFLSYFEIFSGILFIEIEKIIKNNSDITLNPILGDNTFYITNKMYGRIAEYMQIFEKNLLKKDYEILKLNIDNMCDMLDNIVLINKKSDYNGNIYYVFKQTNKFTDRFEFEEFFQNKNIIYFSCFNEGYDKLSMNTNKKDKLNIRKINKKNELIKFLKKNLDEYNIIYILSAKKAKSKELFYQFLEEEFFEYADLFVENITGGYNKIISKLNKQNKTIIIGGPNLLIKLFSKKINIDIVIDFDIKGAMEKYYLNDINYYDIF